MKRESPIRKVPCPTCDAEIGQMCGRVENGWWRRMSYHAERVRLYNANLKAGAFDQPSMNKDGGGK